MGHLVFVKKNINHPPVVRFYRLDKMFACLPAGRETGQIENRFQPLSVRRNLIRNPPLRTMYSHMTSVTQGFSPDSSALPAAPGLACRDGARARWAWREGLSYR